MGLEVEPSLWETKKKKVEPSLRDRREGIPWQSKLAVQEKFIPEFLPIFWFHVCGVFFVHHNATSDTQPTSLGKGRFRILMNILASGPSLFIIVSWQTHN